MENFYNDEMLPSDFEKIAKAYSASLKDKGFVFVRLHEEEFSMLISEVLVLIAKAKACLIKLKNQIDSKKLMCALDRAENLICQKFNNKKPHKFRCVENENNSFLSLISIENLLHLKLLLLGVKSEELELCNDISTSIASIFAESFSCEGFVLSD